MEQTNTLQHFGIKGQKWGLRRFQNKDGSLTEEGKIRYQNDDGSLTDYGKEHYMEGARSGKLDVQKLSDKDLQMINNRFNQERLFDQNVSKFQEEHKPVSEKVAQALVDRITAKANDKNRSPSSSGFKKLFVDPILDAFKFDDLDVQPQQTQQEEEKQPHGATDPEKERGNGRRFFAGYSKKSAKDITNDKPRMNTGKEFADEYNQRADDPSWHKRVNHIDRDDPHNGSQTAESIMRERFKKRKQSNASTSESTSEQPKKHYKLNNGSFGGSGKKKKNNKNNNSNGNSTNNYTYRGYYDSYSAHDAFNGVFVITRDTDGGLAHYGIRGQKWGVRRFENADGTLTTAGKERYGSGKISRKEYRSILKADRKDQREFNKEFKENPSVDMMKAKQGRLNSRAVLERNAGHTRAEVKFKRKADELGYEIARKEDRHPDMDYRNGDESSNYVWNLHQPYLEAASKESVWKKYNLGQDTAFQFLEQKKFADMVDHIESKVKAKREAVAKAADRATKSGETMRKPGQKWEDMNRKSVEYWDEFNDVATDYVNKNFSGDEQDLAKGILFWRFIDW